VLGFFFLAVGGGGFGVGGGSSFPFEEAGPGCKNPSPQHMSGLILTLKKI